MVAQSEGTLDQGTQKGLAVVSSLVYMVYSLRSYLDRLGLRKLGRGTTTTRVYHLGMHQPLSLLTLFETIGWLSNTSTEKIFLGPWTKVALPPRTQAGLENSRWL